MRTLGIIDASPHALSQASTRPAMGRLRLAGLPVLTWAARRISEAQRLDGIVAVIPADGPLAQELADQVPADAAIIRSAAACPIQRIRQAVAGRDCDAVVRVSIDAPFVDPELIDQLVREAEHQRDCDYVSYRCSSGHLATNRIGLFAEWCRVAPIQQWRIDEPLDNLFDFVTSQPQLFTVRLLRVPTALDRPDMRLTLHDAEDYEHLDAIIDALGTENVNWRGIADLLEQHPEIRDRMKTLNRFEDQRQLS